MGKLPITFLAAFAIALPAAVSAQAPRPAPSGEEGFFRPTDDPALTAFRPPPVPREEPPRVFTEAALAPSADPADEVREAAEAQMDRAEIVHAPARHEVVTRLPAITSPLDGTAPILSPLDGTAPILSPLDR
jgi:hypothetical protein